MKKSLSLILMALILSSSLASCGESKTNSDNGGASNADTTESAETTTAEPDYLKDTLPAMDFEGYNFRMFIRNMEDKQKELFVEKADGDLMNDAVYERNSRISELYNVTFSKIDSSDAYGSDADKSILAGDDEYDLIAAHARNSFRYAYTGLARDWNELEYVDITQPWWNQGARSEFSIEGKLYAMVGDILYLDFGAADCMVFNKRLIENYSLESPYDLVESGEWQFDKFTEMAKSAVLDLNGDSVIDYENDRMGYTSQVWLGPIQVLYSAGERIATVKNGRMELCINTPRTIEAFDKYFEFVTSDGMYVFELTESISDSQPFIDGRSLFYDLNVSGTMNLRDMEDDFGIVPWPKLNESVDNYYANVDAGCSALCVPITTQNPECVSLVLEAMGYIGYSEIIPLYYDVVLTTKYARDEQSIAMLEIINSNRVFDIGYYHPDVGEINSIGRWMYNKRNFNFSSYYASIESKSITSLNNINDLYAD